MQDIQNNASKNVEKKLAIKFKKFAYQFFVKSYDLLIYGFLLRP